MKLDITAEDIGDLPVEYRAGEPNVLYVVSRSQPGKQHPVLHDYHRPISCGCKYFKIYRICKSHWVLVQEVLRRFNDRLERENAPVEEEIVSAPPVQQGVNWDNASLGGRVPFTGITFDKRA